MGQCFSHAFAWCHGCHEERGVHIDSVDTTGVDLMGKDWTLQQLKEQTEKLGGASKVVAAVLDKTTSPRWMRKV